MIVYYHPSGESKVNQQRAACYRTPLRLAILGQFHDLPYLSVHQAISKDWWFGRERLSSMTSAQKANINSQNIIDITVLITDLSSPESKHFLTLFILSEVMNSIILLSTLYDIFP